MKVWKRILSTVLSMLLLTTFLPISALAAENEGNTTDAEELIGDGAETAKIELSEGAYAGNGEILLLDTVPSNILVNDGLTRAEWMEDLVLLFGMSIPTDEYPDIYFPDISEETAYFDAIMTAVKYGVVNIEAGDDFEPERALTREFAAQTLNFCLGMQKAAADYTYGDIGAVEYRDDAQVAVEQGWFALVDGDFIPEQEVTADEATAMINSVQAVLDMRNTENGIAEFEFADYVKVIPSSADVASTFDLDMGSTTITISGWDGTLEAGDTFAFYSGDYAFVYGVEKVASTGDAICVTTQDAPAGAILDYAYAGEVDLTLTPDLRDNEPVTLMSADGDPVTFGEVQLLSSHKNSISFSRNFTKGNGLGVKGKLQGTVKDIKLDTKFLGKNKYFTLSGTIEVSSTMDLDFMDDPAADSLFLGGMSLGPFGYVGLELSLKMAAKIGCTFTADFKLGLDYQGGNISYINELNTRNSCLTAEGTASTQLALAARLEFGANGFAAVRLGAGPKMEAKLKQYHTGTPEQCITLTGYLYAGFEAEAKLKELFSGAIIFDYKYSHIFYDEKNSPVRLYKHVENGVEVSFCTRSKDAGTEEPGYTTPKYTTPANSRYYVSGGYGGSADTGGGDTAVVWKTEDNGGGTVIVTGWDSGASILNIPETIDGKTVTAIGDNAFQNNTAIRIAMLPDTVASIGGSAFEGCGNLTIVSFGENLTEINGAAFAGCTSLKQIELPAGLTHLGDYAFSDCASLTQIELPESLPRLGFRAFNNCASLLRIELPEGLTCLDAGAFNNCTAVEYAYIPSTLEICEFGFEGPLNNCASLDDIEFGEGLSLIPEHLFNNCTGLTHIEIPDTVTSIGDSAFNSCVNLKTVSLSENLTEIDSAAFAGCTSLTQIELPWCLTYIGGYAFGNCASLIQIELPEGLTCLSSYTFANCTSLTEIKLPEGLTSLETGVFSNCTALEYVYIPGTLEACEFGLMGPWEGPFNNCASLENIEFGEGLSLIPEFLFNNCTGLTHIEIPDTVTSIESFAFDGCTSLETVKIPVGVTEIKGHTFCNCKALTDLNFLPYTVTSIGDYAFQGCTALTSVKTGANLLSIGDNAFQGCTALTNVKLNDGLTTIGAYAFQGCTALPAIVLPDSVASIGTYCFQKNTALTDVTLSNGLTAIPSYGFANCVSMTDLVIPRGVTSIEANAFYQDTRLKTFTIPATVTSIGSNAFSYPTSTTVYGVKGSYAENFARWKSFVDITSHIVALSLANGTGSMTIGYSLTATPVFTVLPADHTDVIALTSDDPNVVSVRNDRSLYGNGIGTANVTATTSGGLTCTFTVTVDTLSGIEITQMPDTVNYGVKDDKDLTGMVVSAVFSNGSREQVYDYTVSGFTTDSTGDHIVTVTYNGQITAFPITVSKVESGTLGDQAELRWTYSGDSKLVTVTGDAVNVEEPVCVALYDGNGKMVSISIISTSGGKAYIGDDFNCANLLWLDSNSVPKCESVALPVSQ